MSQYFYSGQIRRFLAQFIRVMSGFPVKFGRDDAGDEVFRVVPATYGDPTRQAAAILRNNSSNTLITVPQIACYITALKYSRERMQEPNFVKNVSVQMRKKDVDGNYTDQPGDRFTVERLMPAPYDLTVKADIYCSNADQKMQLLEQILVLFNPSFEIQSTDNYLDWGSLSYINLEEVMWSSRSVPVGPEDTIDVATLTFEMPIWLSTPAKVKKLGVITNVVTQLFDAGGSLRTDLIEAGFTDADFNLADSNGGSTLADIASETSLMSPLTVENTPSRTEDNKLSNELTEKIVYKKRSGTVSQNYDILVIGGKIQLLSKEVGAYDQGIEGNVVARPGDPISWGILNAGFGTIHDGLSRIFLKQGLTPDEVVLTIARDLTDTSLLVYTVDTDTIPSNTLAAVNNFVNPLKKGPGHGLPVKATGQRYMLLEDIGDLMNTDGADAWKGAGSQDLVAYKYDIIQYNGTKWVVSFRAAGTTALNYVTNASTGQQFKWNGVDWVRSWEGLYEDGQWRIVT